MFGQKTDGRAVPGDPEARDRPDADRRQVRVVPETFAGVDVRQVHLDGGQGDTRDRVAQRDRGVRVRAQVQHEPGHALGGGSVQTELSRFTAGQNLMIEGRVGHPKIARNSRGETFVLLEVKGSDTAKPKTAAHVNLAIVMDRSGSMKGSRLPNAIRAATAAVDRLNDGDTVSVITFDTRTSIVVPPTEIGAGSRERPGHGQTESLGATGDHGAPPRQIEHTHVAPR